MKAIIVVFLSALTCFSQPFTFTDPAFRCDTIPATSGSWNPTNNADGTFPYAWYVGDWATITNESGVLTNWQNLVSIYFNLTNNAASGTALPVVSGTLNNHKYVTFDGVNDYLFSQSVTNTQPFEIVALLNYVYAAASSYKGLWEGYGNAGGSARRTDANNLVAVGASTLTDGFMATNTWLIVDIVYNQSSSYIYTNGVLAKSGNVGTLNLNGFHLASISGGNSTYCSPIKVAEVFIYGNTNGTSVLPGTNATYRANLSTYLTNKYGL
jgi:hypothetical protein